MSEWLLLDLEYKLTVGMLLTRGDTVCAEYFVNQRERLLPAILNAAQKQGREPDEVFAAFALKKAQAGSIGGKASGLLRKDEAASKQSAKQDASHGRSQTSDNRLQTSDNNLESSSGERTETLKLVPATSPPKPKGTCSRHPDGNPTDEDCRGCARVADAARKDDERANQRSAEAAVAARLGCPRCEGMGFILDDDKKPTGRKCDPHLPAERVVGLV